MRNLNKLLASTMALVVPLCTWAQTEIEPNNSAGAANALSYNTAMAGSSGTCAPTDVSVDWYSITSTAQGVLRLQTSMSNTGGTDVPVSLLLRNSAQTVIATFVATAGANGVAVDQTFTHFCSGIGVYYISIANPSPSVCTNYSLTYDRLAPDYADDSEPNSSAGQALDTLDAGVPREGQINFEYGDADDWHRILAPNDGVITVTVLAEHADAAPGTMNLRLRNSSSTVLQTWTVNVGASGTPMTNTFTRNCTGAEVHYFLTFDGPSVCGASYRISYTVAAPFYGDDAEPNQSAGPAIIANAGSNYDGRLSFEYDNTIDWFLLQAPNDGLMTVTVLAEHAGALPSEMTVYLRNSSSSVIETWTAVIGANGVPVSNTFTHTCAGTEAVYYLSLDTPDDCGVSYRLNYTVAAPLYADDQEPNQSAGPAIIANAGTDYDGRVTFDYDNTTDWFRLQAPTDGVLSVTVLAENATASTATLFVNLRNSASTIIETWSVGVGASGAPSTTTLTHTCAGTEAVYYLELGNPTVCGTSYRFNYTVAAPLYADDTEPNQSAGPAIVAGAGIDHAGRVSFEYDNATDWFRLQAPTDGVLSVTVLAENADVTTGTLFVNLRNSSSTVIETWSVDVGASGAPSTTTLTHTCSGTESVYFLELGNPDVCGTSYRFNYTVAAPLYADDTEPNQNAGSANVIDLTSAPATGRVSFEYDDATDWFRVTHPGGVLSVVTRAENAGPATTMFMNFRNSSSTVILQDVLTVGGNGIAVLDTMASAGPLAAGTYYIEVGNPAACGVSYQFNCYDDDDDGICNSSDLCAGTPTGEGVNSNGCSCSQVIVDDGDVCTLDACLNGNVTNTFQDADGDLTCDVNDGCPNDPNKIAPGICGCGVADTDTDSDGTANCNDGCPNDPNKIAPGQCGCGVADTDTDSDGTADCNDACPNLANLVNGDPCDDGNPNTINDVVSNCLCSGTLLGNDCEGVPGGPAVPGTACNDNDDCTTGDVYDANCLCTGTFADADGDGTCDADDLCPGGPEPGTACNDNDDCTTGDVIGANCLCAGTFADADGDGTCDADDVCPGGPEPGTPCDDLNAGTINDIIQANCLCAGTLLGNDCLGVPGGSALPGTSCDDGIATTGNDVYGANCVCAGQLIDCLGVAGGSALPGTSCNDNNANTGNDAYGANCVCVGQLIDCLGVVGGSALPGTACNDNNANAINDVYGANCACVGTPIAGCDNWTLELTTDNAGSESTWQIINSTTLSVIGAGGPYVSNTTTTATICIPSGACYRLTVTDANGMSNGTTGGFVLRDQNGKRVLDNAGDGVFTGISQAVAPFCSPVGNDGLIASQCDKVDWTPGGLLIATPNSAVSAQYGVGNQNNDGYEFRIFNPDGGYDRTVFITHANPVPGAPAGPNAACYLGFSSLITNPVPQNVLLNLRVRSAVNGVFSAWGPACRFKIDAAAAACPLAKLISTPGSTFSCGATGKVVNASGVTGRIYAQPVTRPVGGVNQAANAYLFELTNTANGYTRLIGGSSYTLVLGKWFTNPLLCGTHTYNVRVRASFDGGSTYCPWGAVCTVGITNNFAAPFCTAPAAPAMAAGDDRVFFDGDETSTEAVLTLWPNPNNGEQLYVTIDGLQNEVTTATVDIFDMVGHKVATHTIAVNSTTLNTVIALDASMANGMYVVNVTAGEESFMQRLVIQ
ncbi:MAG: T9SS type A sorting domain-containing protein [Flavobacteriales bacterium]|nr:T9SS type A sorting domain-containing protein [Flavobacteriales bacterium]